MDARDRVLRTLSAGNRAMLRATDEQQLLDQMCRVIVEDGGYRLAWVGYARHDAGSSVEVQACTGNPPQRPQRQFSWGDQTQPWTTVTRAIRTGKPCTGRKLASDPDLPQEWREENRKFGLAAVSSFPITLDGAVLGNLSIYSSDEDAFTPDEVELLARLADDLSFGISNLRARAERDRQAAELARVERARRTVSAGNRALLRAQDEAGLLHDMVRAIVDVGGYRVAWVGYAQQDEGKTIQPMAIAGEDQGFFDIAHLSWGDNEFGQSASSTAIRTGKACVGRNLLAEARPAPWHDEALKRGFAAVSSFPLRLEQKVLGCMSIIALETDAFGQAEVDVLAEMAEDLAFGIATLRTRAAHQEAEQTIQRLAFYDRLTGLPNHQRFTGRILQAVESARARNRSFAVLMLGVDHFREVNETLGYTAGDHLLCKIAERLVQEVGVEEAVARCGEAEFGVLLARADAESALRMARKLSLLLYDPIEMDGLMLDARASIGVALYPGQGTDPELLIRRATIAMQPSRRAGGTPTIYAGGLDKKGASRLSLMGDLHRAIQNDELMLYCQPKVRMATERICGAEALVRWNHPKLGMISASEFISLAEQGGLINPLTDWVMHAAFRESYAWHRLGLDVPLAVNLSTRDLRDPHLPERICGMIATWGAEPDWVQFELTESALMQDPQGCLERLTQLKDLGTELYIDDFGTGYSSLSYLQRLPVDAIKIDKSFVEDMLTDHGSEVIVRSTIDLAHNLDLQVVAEGVENRDYWARLAQSGCDVAQGYEISKPIPAGEFKSWQAQSNWKL